MNATWTDEELGRIGTADDLHIAPYRADGVPGTLTWIWSVVVGDGLYVRAYHGRESSWYQSAVAYREGIIRTVGIERQVTFEPVDGRIQDAIDAAFLDKYAGQEYVDEMVLDPPRSATIRIAPRED